MHSWGKLIIKALAAVDFPTVRAVAAPINLSDLSQRMYNAGDIDPATPSDLPKRQRAAVRWITTLHRDKEWSLILPSTFGSGSVDLEAYDHYRF